MGFGLTGGLIVLVGIINLLVNIGFIYLIYVIIKKLITHYNKGAKQ